MVQLDHPCTPKLSTDGIYVSMYIRKSGDPATTGPSLRQTHCFNNTLGRTCIMPSATSCEPFTLSEEQKEHFLEHGFVKVEDCFSREEAEKFCGSIWTRMGASPDDKSTWPTEKINMPGHTTVAVTDFAPKAYDAISELIGGEDRMADWTKTWKDGWIINLGKPEFKPEDPLDFRTLDNWHNDGDWFVHFLDSGEQALLVIPLFSDIEPKGGGTVICTDGIGLVAKHMVSRFVMFHKSTKESSVVATSCKRRDASQSVADKLLETVATPRRHYSFPRPMGIPGYPRPRTSEDVDKLGQQPRVDTRRQLPRSHRQGWRCLLFAPPDAALSVAQSAPTSSHYHQPACGP